MNLEGKINENKVSIRAGALRVIPGGNQVDGLPPVPSNTGSDQELVACFG